MKPENIQIISQQAHLLFAVKLVDIHALHFCFKLKAFFGWVEQKPAYESHIVSYLSLNIIIEF
jgi:hypothetical protein